MKKILLVLILLFSSLPARAQLGTPFIAPNLSVIPCVTGNLGYQTASPIGFYTCTSPNTWTLVVTAGTIVLSGPSLPSTCIVGSMFTVTPIGALYTCSSLNDYSPVGSTVARKIVTGIQNNVFTDLLTFTVPNQGTAAFVEVVIRGSLGAGGAIGEYEASTGRTLNVIITRTPNLSTDAAISIVSSTLDARVTGSAAIAQAAQLSSIVGANTATQTFTLQYRITRGSGTSNNHIAAVLARDISTSITIE